MQSRNYKRNDKETTERRQDDGVGILPSFSTLASGPTVAALSRPEKCRRSEINKFAIFVCKIVLNTANFIERLADLSSFASILYKHSIISVFANGKNWKKINIDPES
jgi:hypothetical protein